jgi:hypothetical protein
LARDLHLVQKLIPIDKKIGRYSFKKVTFVLHIPTGSCVKTLSCSDGHLGF